MPTANGLPKIYADKLFWIEDDQRINNLSRQPGGVTLVIVYNNGKVLGYDKIKYPSKYSEVVVSKEVGEEINNIYMSNYVDTVFVKTELGLNFVEVWPKKQEQPESLSDALRPYDPLRQDNGNEWG